MATRPHFSRDALAFLADLAAHNDREWFAAHRDRYVRSLRDPYLRFLQDLAPRLAKLSAHFVVDTAPTGGSLARIHRDMRFVTDGKPFKTALSAHFAHDEGRDGATPSLFLYVAPKGTYVGGGVRSPSARSARRIRTAIARDEPRYERAIAGLAVQRFVATVPIPTARVSQASFLDDVVTAYKRLVPFVQLLTKALGLPG